jgi:hypothetical protein
MQKGRLSAALLFLDFCLCYASVTIHLSVRWSLLMIKVGFSGKTGHMNVWA